MRIRNMSGRFRRGGMATLETALTLGILFQVCFGTIEFGYYFYVKNTCCGAAREGARAAIVAGATQSDVTTAVTNVLTAAGMTSANFTTTTSPASITSATMGTTVTVTVSGTWGTVGSGFRPMGLIGAAKVVTGATAMRKEG